MFVRSITNIYIQLLRGYLQGKVAKCNLQLWPIFFPQIGTEFPFTNPKGFVPLFWLRRNKRLSKNKVYALALDSQLIFMLVRETDIVFLSFPLKCYKISSFMNEERTNHYWICLSVSRTLLDVYALRVGKVLRTAKSRYE